jgi:hypothetical protein
VKRRMTSLVVVYEGVVMFKNRPILMLFNLTVEKDESRGGNEGMAAFKSWSRAMLLT